MQDNLLNPLHPTNPSQQIQEGTPVSNKTVENVYHENSDGVFLPSRGLFYLGENKGLEYLKVRPLDYTDEDILTTESYYENNTIFDEILNNTIVDQNGFKAKDLVPVDRDTILLWLRSTSFGNEFTVEYTCPICGGGNGHSKRAGLKKGPGEMTWFLNELSIPEYSEEVYNQFNTEGSILISTPMKNVKVRITVPTVGQQNALKKNYIKKKEALNTTKDFFATTTLLSVVSGVEVADGKWTYHKDEISSYFKHIRLPLSDSRYILKKAADYSLKYDTKKDFICPDCNHIQEGVEMPILHKNFFWLQPE